MKLSALSNPKLARLHSRLLMQLAKASAEMERRLIGTQKTEQTLAEIVDGLPPLIYETENEHWVTKKRVGQLLNISLKEMKQPEQRSQKYPKDGIIYGQTSDGYIWCRPSGTRKTFYLKSSLNLIK